MPAIEEFPEDTNATVGETVVFQVSVNGRPVPSLTWFHDNSEICLNSTQTVQGDGSLNIPSVSVKDGGVYVLVASNCVGSVQQVVNLTVKHPEEENVAKEDGWKAASAVPPVLVGTFRNYVAEHHAAHNLQLIEQFKVCSMLRTQCRQSRSSRSTRQLPDQV